MMALGMTALAMIPLAPLLADIADWIKVAPFIVVFVLWVIKRVMGAEAQGPKPNVRRPEVARPAKPVAAPVERKRIDDEVGDFLRRAAQQRAAGQGAAGQQGQQQGQQQRQQADKRRPVQPAAPPPAAPQPAARRSLVDRPVPARPAAAQAVEIEAVDIEVLDDVYAGRSVAAHVQQHGGGRSVAQRGPHGEEVEHAVQVMKAHLQETFDHEVGHLGSRSAPDASTAAPPADEALPTANQLRTMLTSPQGVGQAILLGEILRRPEERW